MTVTIAGFERTRAHQFGRQSAFGTPVAATRRYSFKGVPSINLGWTDPDVDEGSIDPVQSPYLVAPDLTASLTDPAVRYNNLPIMLTAAFGNTVTPTGSGTAKTWDFNIAHDGSDEQDVFTYEHGNTDVTTDWFQMGDGFLETLEITGPDGLGACTASMGWRFGSVFSSGSTDRPDAPTVPTSLSVPLDETVVYLKDAKIEIGSTVSGLAQVSDALHTFTLRVNKTVDMKRFANATQSFAPSAVATGARSIELECSWAKSADTVGTGSESDAWMSDPDSVTRIVKVTFTSLANAQTSGAIKYSWNFSMPMRYYTRTEGAIGGNSIIVLTGHAFYLSTDFSGVFKSTAVTTLASL